MSFTRRVPFLLINDFAVTPHRIILTLYTVVLGALGIAAGVAYLDARAEYNQLKQMEILSRQKLVAAQTRLQEQQRILERLKSDPAYVERAVRQRLNYAKPGEVIFRFPE